jgi:Fic family protein
MDAQGHSEAFRILQKGVEDGIALTEEFVKDLHYYVLKHDQTERGNYRTHNVMISGSSIRLPDYREVSGKMESLINDIAESKLHPVEKAAVYHLDF